MNDEARANTLTVQQEAALLLWRIHTANVAALAIQLAQEAGEEVKRPLAPQQLLRAMEVMDAEADTVHESGWPGLPLR